jgi:hypothetical protein
MPGTAATTLTIDVRWVRVLVAWPIISRQSPPRRLVAVTALIDDASA